MLSVPESNDPLSAVTVCSSEPSLVHVTLAPTVTVKSRGSKKLFPIATLAANPGVGPTTTSARTIGATLRVRILSKGRCTC